MPVSEATAPGPKESTLGAPVDDSPQKKHLTPKATPPPSPLLSELLKKGSLIPANSRLVRQRYLCYTYLYAFINLADAFILSNIN